MTSPAAELAYPISSHLTLIDIIGACEVEGEEGACYVEMSWPPEYLERNRGQRSLTATRILNRRTRSHVSGQRS